MRLEPFDHTASQIIDQPAPPDRQRAARAFGRAISGHLRTLVAVGWLLLIVLVPLTVNLWGQQPFELPTTRYHAIRRARPLLIALVITSLPLMLLSLLQSAGWQLRRSAGR